MNANSEMLKRVTALSVIISKNSSLDPCWSFKTDDEDKTYTSFNV